VLEHFSVIEQGDSISKSTLTFDAASGQTSIMRSKEEADDYRYFPEPDLPPLELTEAYIESVRSSIPPLPNELIEKYINELSLGEYEAGVLTEDKYFALYFEELLKHVPKAKSAANWMMGEVKSYLNEMAIEIEQFPIQPAQLLIHSLHFGK